MLLVRQREPVEALVVEAAELAHEARPALVQLATNKSLRGETARRDARVERVRRFPVERERRISAQRERDEARLPAQAERDVQGGDGDRPAFALAAAIPGVIGERVDGRRGLLDGGLDVRCERHGASATRRPEKYESTHSMRSVARFRTPRSWRR